MRDVVAAYADGSQAWDSLWVYDHFHTVPVGGDVDEVETPALRDEQSKAHETRL